MVPAHMVDVVPAHMIDVDRELGQIAQPAFSGRIVGISFLAQEAHSTDMTFAVAAPPVPIADFLTYDIPVAARPLVVG